MAVATDDGSSFNLTYAWDLLGDGDFDDLVPASRPSRRVPCRAPTGHVEVAVRVTDAEGATRVGRLLPAVAERRAAGPAGHQPQPAAAAGRARRGSRSRSAWRRTPRRSSGTTTATASTAQRWPGDQLAKTYATPGTYVVRVRCDRHAGASVVTSRHAVTPSRRRPANPPAVGLAPVGSSTVRTGAPVTLQVNSFDAPTARARSPTRGTSTRTASSTTDQLGGGSQPSPRRASMRSRCVTTPTGGVSTQYKTLEVHTANRAPLIQITRGPGGQRGRAAAGRAVTRFPARRLQRRPDRRLGVGHGRHGQFDDGTTAPDDGQLLRGRAAPRLPSRHRLRRVDRCRRPARRSAKPAQANRAPDGPPSCARRRHVRTRDTGQPGRLGLRSRRRRAHVCLGRRRRRRLRRWRRPHDLVRLSQAGRSYDVAVKVTDALGASRTMLQTLVVDPTAASAPCSLLTFFGSGAGGCADPAGHVRALLGAG